MDFDEKGVNKLYSKQFIHDLNRYACCGRCKMAKNLRVKVFCARFDNCAESKAYEDTINLWLINNPDLDIIDVVNGQSESAHHSPDGSLHLTMFIYTI